MLFGTSGYRLSAFSHHIKPYDLLAADGCCTALTQLPEISCSFFHFPFLKNNNPNLAWSSVLINSPPPKCPPPLTDCIINPSIFTKELSYPYQRQVVEAPIGSIIFSFNTIGRGLRHTCSKE